MPLRELRMPQQIEDWLEEWGVRLSRPGRLILIGSGALLWHAHQAGLQVALPENSMDVDPVTDDDEVAWLAYDACIGSEFERLHGWHVNLMPHDVLRELPAGWETRARTKVYTLLTVQVPLAEDLLFPKLKRNEPRDRLHAEWARQLNL